MTAKIPDFSESIADAQGKASRNWFNYWKDLGSGIRSGSFTLTVSTATITFPTPQPTNDYNVFFDHPLGSPTWATNKGTMSFVAHSTGAGGTLTFIGWSLIRR